MWSWSDSPISQTGIEQVLPWEDGPPQTPVTHSGESDSKLAVEKPGNSWESEPLTREFLRREAAHLQLHRKEQGDLTDCSVSCCGNSWPCCSSAPRTRQEAIAADVMPLEVHRTVPLAHSEPWETALSLSGTRSWWKEDRAPQMRLL